MTHNEIYYKALKSFPYGDLHSIERAIRVAIEEEREACAKLAEEKCEDGEWYMVRLAEGIAEDIRARSNASSASQED